MRDYTIMVVVTSGVGSLTLTTMLTMRLRCFAKLGMTATYAIVLIGINCVAATVLGPGIMLHPDQWQHNIIQVVTSFPLGCVVYFLDSRIARDLSFKSRTRPRDSKKDYAANTVFSPRIEKVSFRGGDRKTQKKLIPRYNLKRQRGNK